MRNAMALLAATALLLFGIPLAVAVQRVLNGEALSALQREATRAVDAVPDNTLEAGGSVRAPRGYGETRIALYDSKGGHVAGPGPARSPLAGRAADGKEHSGREAGELVVVAPVLSDTTVAGSVRAALPLTSIRRQVVLAWVALAALALVVLLVTSLLARRAARSIAAPFEQLTAAVRSLGEGSFDIALPRWGLREADAAAVALQDTARDMGQLVTQERDFVRHASHQLRTPLAGLLVQLEQLSRHDSTPAAGAALERARQLESTLNDLLLVRSPAVRETCDPAIVAGEVIARWKSATPRALELRAAAADPVAVPGAAVRQALEVLIDNAVRHGSGTVTVTVEPLGSSIVVEVADEGAGFAGDVGPGTGLRLATGLMQRFGGDLLIRRRSPRPRVALLLPQASSTSNR